MTIENIILHASQKNFVDFKEALGAIVEEKFSVAISEEVAECQANLFVEKDEKDEKDMKDSKDNPKEEEDADGDDSEDDKDDEESGSKGKFNTEKGKDKKDMKEGFGPSKDEVELFSDAKLTKWLDDNNIAWGQNTSKTIIVNKKDAKLIKSKFSSAFLESKAEGYDDPAYRAAVKECEGRKVSKSEFAQILAKHHSNMDK